MQLLLHGWLAVEWGHSPLFLAIFAVARIVPKIVLTVPAGIICDRVPRTRVLFGARIGYALASLLPLLGLIAPMPMAWLLAGVVLAGAIHAFDLSSSRAVFGDIIDRDDLHAAAALNRAGFHIASLVGPALAFVLISGVGSGAALTVSATMLGAGALAVLPLHTGVVAVRNGAVAAASGGLLRYLKESPVAVLLIAAGIVPTFIDKAVALLLPSVAHGGGGTVSMALIAPELGALVMASVLAIAPIRLGAKVLIGTAMVYAVLIFTASTHAHEAEALVMALGLAGMASAALNTTTYANLQRLVPAEMRGRVFAV